MKVVVAGGTGFLGSALAASLRLDGHHVLVMTRHPKTHDEVPWTDPSVFDGADAVVNLAGEPLDAGRWTEARKASILESRIKSTETLVKGMSSVTRRPAVFLNASAVGVYGTHGPEALTEESPPGSNFLASICVRWEAAAMAAAWMTRVVLLRTGLPLDETGGALPKLALPFRLFAGGRVGSGDQYWSWIHLDDWTRLVRWAIDSPEIKGPINLTAPSPVTNREFTAALAHALHRPALAPAPAFALRLLLGEMADAVILSGQRVLPATAMRNGFEFRYPDLQSALRQIYQ
jgi:uncharacterized protein (TIGR01777 family)